MIAEVEILCESDLHLYSPVPRLNGEIVMACENGTIVKLNEKRTLEKMFTVGGQSHGIAMETDSSILA